MKLAALPLAVAALAATAAAKSGPTCVAYVSSHDGKMADLGAYHLADGSNVFDIGIIFAANINYNGSAAVLYNNPTVQAILNGAAKQIQPLQAKGIKVLLSLLGNHEGAGVSNFATKAAATTFAKTISQAVVKYGLDGIDIDDEYADYGTNGTSQPRHNSIAWFISALRSAMPAGKLITFYNIGPAATALEQDPASVGSQLDFAWNPYYGEFNVPDISGLNKSQLSPSAIWYAQTSKSDAKALANDTLSGGYGAYLTFALPTGDQSSYISSFTQVLYGQNATYSL